MTPTDEMIDRHCMYEVTCKACEITARSMMPKKEWTCSSQCEIKWLRGNYQRGVDAAIEALMQCVLEDWNNWHDRPYGLVEHIKKLMCK